MNSYAELTNWIIVISDLFRISLWLFVSDRFFISLCDRECFCVSCKLMCTRVYCTTQDYIVFNIVFSFGLIREHAFL